jgi:hypothetical protein
MFNTLSKTGTGAAIVVIINALFPLLGIDVPEGSVQATLESILNVVGFILLIWGQVARKDLKLGLVRK